ncbi:hypothetical protein SteCoe_36661 [Stentor coeruleus]|uniref:Amino acid transporter transmembrane domain-containing protein n=1 Tax=Stentor coeruleus TaxID=5963 RepID=A0A1R2APV4_9CILI|nr:hypothetical protein SteCoe_36661 [Stentor coeruleus]
MKKISLFAFALNQTVGVGLLGIPYAFQKSGLLFGTFALAFCCCVSYYIGTLAVELIFKDAGLKEPLNGKKTKLYVELVDKGPSHALSILYTVFGFVLLIAYFLVFASSFSDNIPLPFLPACDIYNTTQSWCIINFRIYLTIYAIVIYFFALRGVHEQKWLQIIISSFCGLLISLLILVALVRIFTNGLNSSNSFINFNNIGQGFSIILFAATFQHSLPSIAEICENSILDIPKLICSFVFVAYTIMGIIIPLAFDEVEEQCNLNYSYLSGWFGEIIKLIIIVFPAMNCVGSGPVLAIMISDNITASYGHKTQKVEIFIKTFLIFAACLTAFFIHDLVEAIEIDGLILMLIVYIIIPIIHLIHKRHDASTKYDSVAYDPKISYFIIGLSSIYFLYRLFSLFYNLFS